MHDYVRRLVRQILSEAILADDTRTDKSRYLVAILRRSAHPDHPEADKIASSVAEFVLLPAEPGYAYKWEKQAKQKKPHYWTSIPNSDPKGNDLWTMAHPRAAFIVDHNAGVVNFDLEEVDQEKNRRPSLKSNSRTYTILNTDPAEGASPASVKLLLDVIKIDPAVAQLTVAGTELTVRQYVVKNRQSVVHWVTSPTSQALYLFHGTSAKRWETIKKQGLKPGSTPASSDGQRYGDQVVGYSEHNVYLTSKPKEAANYASRLASVDKSEAVILKVRVPDLTKLRPDEDTLWWLFSMPGGKELAAKLGIANDTHFKHYGPRNPMPAELWKFYSNLTVHSLRNRTVAYKGWIHPSNIQFFKSYKIVGMSRDPDDEEFNAAMAKSRATLKTSDTPVKKNRAPKTTIA